MNAISYYNLEWKLHTRNQQSHRHEMAARRPPRSAWRLESPGHSATACEGNNEAKLAAEQVDRARRNLSAIRLSFAAGQHNRIAFTLRRASGR